jgi:indole-3-glycerol phosphate synthase
MILDEIIAHKRTEVDAAQSRVSMAELTAQCADAPAVRDFAAALRSPKGRCGLIAEIKQASPSAGVIAPGFDPIRMAAEYRDAGADCLSVLTDEKFFKGALADMVAARAESGLPVLRKDFVIDEYQIHEARATGADAVLLIVAALTPSQIEAYQHCAWDFGMAALVETHTEAEMEIALAADAKLIGINSRNLQTFAVSLDIVELVSKMVPSGVTLVGESGIKTRADVDRLIASGVGAMLIGETLMRSGDVAGSVRELVGLD